MIRTIYTINPKENELILVFCNINQDLHGRFPVGINVLVSGEEVTECEGDRM